MEDTQNKRDWLHRMIDMIDEGDLDAVKWLTQPYVARALNKKYREENSHEEHR